VNDSPNSFLKPTTGIDFPTFFGENFSREKSTKNQLQGTILRNKLRYQQKLSFTVLNTDGGKRLSVL
jgi:hypothetical protein